MVVMVTTQDRMNLPLLHTGKVRETYELGDDGRLLMVATDRISAFDVVLPNGIPNKGLVLNRMSAFWFGKTEHIVPNHFLCLADVSERGVVYSFRDNSSVVNLPVEIARQAMVVKRAQRIDIECIMRGYITGSAWAEYRRHGTVSGKTMPKGMVEGERFAYPLFTPTTKAEQGHDQNMTWQQVVGMVGEDLAHQLEEVSVRVYQFAHEYAMGRGIILADTKMEFGLLDGQLILIDELFTPDSSRFWDSKQYKPGRSLPNFDKQYVRDWLTAQGWDRNPPAPQLPEEVVARTSKLYLEVYHRLTGERL